MRTGIYKEDKEEGVRTFDLQKALGKYYNRGRFTNTRNCRYRLFKGARNSKKSFNIIGTESVIRMISDDVTNILVIRRDNVDNRNSTFSNIERAIHDFGLEKMFAINRSYLEITYIGGGINSPGYGRKIIFRGLNDPGSLTSTMPAVGRLTAVYIEEAFEIQSFEDFRRLDQSLRAEGKTYNEEGELVDVNYNLQITMCFNAWSKEHRLYQKFFEGRLEDDVNYLETHPYMDYKDENFVGEFGVGLYLHISTFRANEFRDRSQDIAAEQMKSVIPDYYRTIFLGCWGVASASVYPEFRPETNIIPSAEAEDISKYKFTKFAIGIDTGMSAGDGSKIKVKKTDDPTLRVKAANTMCLIGIVGNYEKIIALDEYFHSNDPAYSKFNSDSEYSLLIDEQVEAYIEKIYEWADLYRDTRSDMLMKGRVDVYVDSADSGMLQALSIHSGKVANIVRATPGGKKIDMLFTPSSKSPIAGRVDFERLMFAYKNLLISDKCKNLKREIQNARRGDKGEARLDGNDHVITAFEYAMLPYRNKFALQQKYLKDYGMPV